MNDTFEESKEGWMAIVECHVRDYARETGSAFARFILNCFNLRKLDK